MKLSIKEMVLVSMFAALSCIPGLLLKFAVVEGSVPFSILPVIVFLSGILLGGRLAALSMIIYVVIGLLGVPVFAAPPYGGLAYLVKPTAGFLFGFILGSFITGKIVEIMKTTSFRGYFLAACLGLAAIYLMGLTYFYAIMNFYVGKAISILAVLKIAFLPFIGLDLIKAVTASLLAIPISKQINNWRNFNNR